METIQIHLNNLADTEKLGRLLGNLSASGDIICLDGDLGVGKTALTQAIARGLDMPDNCYVTSPSFAVLHVYEEGRIPMYHMDFYRLQDESEVEDLGFDEYFYLSGLTVIEWSMRAIGILPAERLVLTMVQNADLSRTIFIKGSKRYAEIMQHINLLFND